jgi:phage-related protein (TIGR01555 family)
VRKANRGSFKPGTSGNPRGRVKRTDSVFNPYSGHGTSSDRRRYSSFSLDLVSDREAINLWRSNWLARTIIEALPQDAFRRGYDLATDDKEGAEEVIAIAETLGLNAIVEQAAMSERAYGGGAIFLAIDDGREPSAEVDEANVMAVDALHLIEPRELQPVRWYADLQSPKFNTPELWRFMPLSGRTGSSTTSIVHESRLVVFGGKQVSKQVQPGQREGWGDSTLMPVREVIADAGLGWGSAATLVAEFAQGVMKMDGLEEMLAAKDGEALLQRRVEAMDLMASSMRTKLIGKNDEYTRQSTPISGLDSVLLILLQIAAGAAEMPMTRLMGMSPGGLNATGESDTRNWYDTVGRAQTTKYTSPVERVLRLIMLSHTGPLAGVEPDVWSIAWKPLWTPSEKEQAETRMIQAQTDAVYLDRSVVTPMEIATSRFGGDTWSAETRVDPEAREQALMLPRMPADPGEQP